MCSKVWQSNHTMTRMVNSGHLRENLSFLVQQLQMQHSCKFLEMNQNTLTSVEVGCYCDCRFVSESGFGKRGKPEIEVRKPSAWPVH